MKKSIIISLALILIVLPTLLPYFNSKFFYTQDYIFIARLQQMSTALSSGQFPVRWAPDLRYGEPIFNFYAPLPYYIGALVHLLGFNFIWVAKILFMLSGVLSAVAMYLLVNKLFGSRPAMLAAVLYTYAPYRAVDMYVRGSLSETWAFIFFPLIFYSSVVLVEKINFRNVGLLSLSMAGLFLTHNVTTLMFLPFLGLWWVYLSITEVLKASQSQWVRRFLTNFSYFCFAGILALGLAAFFLLPALIENNFIQTKYLTVGYFNFRAHFVSYKQFFSLFWGYGSSLWGLDDGLSFQVGLVNIVIVGLTAMMAIWHRKNKKLFLLSLFLGASFLISLFLQHNKSAFIWEAVPQMAFIQFPWRFLGISVFIVAIMGGVIAVYLRKKLIPLFVILMFASIISTLSYFKPKEYVDDSFFDKFLQVDIMQKGVDLTKDYLPIWVQTTEGDRFNEPRALTGNIKVSGLKQQSTKLSFAINVASAGAIEVPVTYFPGWEVRANNKIIPQKLPSKMGLINFELNEGSYYVDVQLKDTSVRRVGNIISLISILIVLATFIFKRGKLHA